MESINATGWSEDKVRALEALDRELAAEQHAAEQLAAAEVARAASPDGVLEAKRLEVAAARRARQLAVATAEGERIYREACLKWGEDRVIILRTDRTPVVLRPMSDAEIEVTRKRTLDLRTKDQNADDPLNADQIGANRDQLKRTVLFPPLRGGAGAEVVGVTFEELVGDSPGVWTDLYAARDIIISGRAKTIAGKG